MEARYITTRQAVKMGFFTSVDQAKKLRMAYLSKHLVRTTEGS